MTTEVTTHESSVSWREAVLRLFTRDSNGGDQNSAARAGIFERSSRVSVQHSHFTINNYGDIVPHNALPAAVEEQRPIANAEDESRDLPQQRSPSPRRRAQDVYVDSFLTSERGFPLWIPAPNMALPPQNYQRGVTLGDVGVLTPEGGFDFFFNIFCHATDPVNSYVGVPESFVPLTLPPGVTSEQLEWNAGTYLAESMRRVDDGRNFLRERTFEVQGSEAAVLMIPEDSTAHCLRISDLLRTYFKDHIASWYKFCKYTLGYDIQNGDLRVVSACRKSSGFGLAAAFNTQNQPPTSLTFVVNGSLSGNRVSTECPYHWDHTGSAEVRAGPSRVERRALSQLSTTGEPVANQCLFISTIDSKVSDEVWRSMEQLDMEEDPQLTKDLPTQQSSSGSPRAPTTSENSVQGSAIFSDSESSGTKRAPHPSAILHSIQETMLPGRSVYIVTHEDWEAFFREKNTVHDLVGRVLSNTILVEHQDSVYFLPKSECPPEGYLATITFKQDVASDSWRCVCIPAHEHTVRYSNPHDPHVNVEELDAEYQRALQTRYPAYGLEQAQVSVDDGILEPEFNVQKEQAVSTQSQVQPSKPLLSVYTKRRPPVIVAGSSKGLRGGFVPGKARSLLSQSIGHSGSAEFRSGSGSGARTRGGILRRRFGKGKERAASHSVEEEREATGEDEQKSDLRGALPTQPTLVDPPSTSEPAAPLVRPLLRPIVNHKGGRQLEELLKMEHRSHQLASRQVSAVALEGRLPPVVAPLAPSPRPNARSASQGYGKSPRTKSPISQRAGTSRSSGSRSENLQDPQLLKVLYHVMDLSSNGNRPKKAVLATSESEEDDEEGYETETDVDQAGLVAALSQPAPEDVPEQSNDDDDEWSSATDDVDDSSPPSQARPRPSHHDDRDQGTSQQPPANFSHYPAGRTLRDVKQQLAKQEQELAELQRQQEHYLFRRQQRQQNARRSKSQRDTIEITRLPSESLQNRTLAKLRNDNVGGLTRLLNPSEYTDD